jgi:hypothetical protein
MMLPIRTPWCSPILSLDVTRYLNGVVPIDFIYYMVRSHGETVASHHGKDLWYCAMAIRWVTPSLITIIPVVFITMVYHVDFHAGGPMGSKYHGKNSWCFMGAEFLPQTPWDRNTMGRLHGFSWVPNFYLKRHGIEIPWGDFMGFHGCRISTSNAMGSKYHGGTSWVFMGAEFLPQTPWDRNTMGGLHGFSWVPNFYLKSHGV